jgi:hypothetical protein
MSVSGLAKFVLGFFVGILILAAAGGAITLYMLNKLTTPPPKPIFAEELPKQKPVSKNLTKSKTAYVSLQKQASVPSPAPSTTPSPEKQLEPGAYKARVKWRSGLSMRSQPSFDSEKVGGIGYNQPVVVLKESDDKVWQQVRVEDSNLEGWIKAGNLERVEGQ